MNGVDNMLYIQSTNANDGTMTQVVTFDVGTEHRHRQRAGAEPLLAGAAAPAAGRQELRRHDQEVAGVPADRRLAVLARRALRRRRSSPTTRPSTSTTRSLRVKGVGDIRNFGASRLRDAHLAQARRAGAPRASPSTDVQNAIRAQNVVNPAGQIGAEPAPPGQQLTYTVRAQGRLVDARGVRRRHRAREPRRLAACACSDVARVELGALNYQQYGTLQRQAGRASSPRSRSPGSNALDVAASSRARRWTSSQKRFPPGIDYEVSLDTTRAGERGHRGDRHHAARGDRRWSCWWCSSSCRAGARR